MSDRFPKASTRLYAILARKAPFAVVFRRGPSKQVLTIGWDTGSHEFRMGQWFKGRIYEHRCDLSPSGEKLIYFAAKHRGPLGTWTAVSRPPYLTALALWPKGDAWGGGGLFKNERTISLNHSSFNLSEGFQLPRAIAVEPCGLRSGSGEDDPILSERLKRDGWRLRQSSGGWKTNKGNRGIRYELKKEQIWAKSRGRWTLESALVGMNETEGPWYVTTHRVLDAEGVVVLDLGRSDWADWSHSDELLFAREGRLYRVPTQGKASLTEPEELVDLRDLKFEPAPAPQEANLWKGREPRGKLLPRS